MGNCLINRLHCLAKTIYFQEKKKCLESLFSLTANLSTSCFLVCARAKQGRGKYGPLDVSSVSKHCPNPKHSLKAQQSFT